MKRPTPNFNRAKMYLALSPYSPIEQIGKGGKSEVWRVMSLGPPENGPTNGPTNGSEDGPKNGSLGNKRYAVAKLLPSGEDSARAIHHEKCVLSTLPIGMAPMYQWSSVDEEYPTLILDMAMGGVVRPGVRPLETSRSIVRWLMQLHAFGVVHGDLKPSHVFIQNNTIQIIDFGSSVHAHSVGSHECTPGFSAPELLVGGVATVAADTYSLCAILFWLFSGEAVFTGGQRLLVEAHKRWEPRQLAFLCMISSKLNIAVHEGLSKLPSDRPSLEKILVALDSEPSSKRTPVLARLPKMRQVYQLVAVSPRQELTTLLGIGRDNQFDLCAWNTDEALFISGVGTELSATQLAQALAGDGRHVVIERRSFSVRKTRRGHAKPILDGDALLREILELGRIRAIRPEMDLPTRSPFLGRDELIGEVASLLQQVEPNQPGVVELITTVGIGGSRISEFIGSSGHGCIWREGQVVPPIAIVDDAHRLSRDAMQVLNTAIEDGRCFGVVVVVKAGARCVIRIAAPTIARIHVQPLSADAAVALFSHLIPEHTAWTDEQRRFLIEWTGGIPALIVEVATIAIQDGFVAPRSEGKAVFADFAGLQNGLSLTGAQRVVEWYERVLPIAGLQIAFELCLSERNTITELQYTRWRIPSEDVRLDLVSGLELLKEHGLLVMEGESVGLHSELLRRALYAQLGRDEWRSRHRVHLQHWLRQPDGEHRDHALAHHGAASGRNRLAVNAGLRLAERAMREGSCASAEHSIDQCLHRCTPEQRYSLLLRRAEVRMRSDRMQAALLDAEEATEIATDASSVVRGLLIQSTVYDWMRNYRESENKSKLAFVTTNERPSRDIRGELLVASGRNAWRNGDLRRARSTLCRATKNAIGLSRRVAYLLMPLATLGLGYPELARDELEDAIALCEQEKDWLHLCAALGNRSMVWSVLGMPMQAEKDLHRMIELARLTGHRTPERVAAFNLAEDLFWAGRDEEALRLARRARLLYREFEVHQTSIYSLLEARVLTSMGAVEGARSILKESSFKGDADSIAIAQSLSYFLFPDENDEEMDPLCTMGKLPNEVKLEVAYWLAYSALNHGRIGHAIQYLTQARGFLSAAPVFESRLRELEAEVHDGSRL